MNQADDSNVPQTLKERFEGVLAQRSERLFGIVFRWTHDADLTGDLVQEAFERFLSRMEKTNWSLDINSLDAYLITIARNCRINQLRKQERFESLDSDPDGKLHKEAYQALLASQRLTGLDPEALEELQKAVPQKVILGDITRDDMELLKLHWVEGLPPRKIAARIGADSDKIRYRLGKIEAKIRYRAKQYLKTSGKKSLF